jgi:hypothetical protein
MRLAKEEAERKVDEVTLRLRSETKLNDIRNKSNGRSNSIRPPNASNHWSTSTYAPPNTINDNTNSKWEAFKHSNS